MRGGYELFHRTDVSVSFRRFGFFCCLLAEDDIGGAVCGLRAGGAAGAGGASAKLPAVLARVEFLADRLVFCDPGSLFSEASAGAREAIPVVPLFLVYGFRQDRDLCPGRGGFSRRNDFRAGLPAQPAPHCGATGYCASGPVAAGVARRRLSGHAVAGEADRPRHRVVYRAHYRAQQAAPPDPGGLPRHWTGHRAGVFPRTDLRWWRPAGAHVLESAVEPTQHAVSGG